MKIDNLPRSGPRRARGVEKGFALPFELRRRAQVKDGRPSQERRRQGESNAIPEGTHRVAAGLGTAADSCLQRFQRAEDGGPDPHALAGAHCFQDRPGPRPVHLPFDVAGDASRRDAVAARIRRAKIDRGVAFSGYESDNPRSPARWRSDGELHPDTYLARVGSSC